MTRLQRGLLTLGILIILWFIPVPDGLSLNAWHLFAVFATVIAGFILKPLPLGVVALSGVTLAALLNLVKPAQALSGYSNTTIWLIVSAFLIAKGFQTTGLGRRIAFHLIRAFGSSSLRLSYMLALSEYIIAPAMPAQTARSGGIMFPIVKSLASAFGSEPGATAKKIGSYLMTVSIQCDAPISASFLTACAPNLLLIQLASDTAGLTMSWGTWALACAPLGIISLLILPSVIYRLDPPEIKQTPEAKKIAGQELKKMGPMTKKEKRLALLLLCALGIWSTSTITHINTTMSALLVVIIMVAADILTWQDILADTSAWDAMIWMGGAVALASLLNESGFIAWFAQSVTTMLAGVSWQITFVLLLLVYLYSHYAFASLSAHVTAMYAAFLAVLIVSGTPMYLAAFGLAACSTLFAALTNYASGPAPLFFGAGYISQKEWLSIGFICSLINFIIWIGFGSFYWKLIGLW